MPGCSDTFAIRWIGTWCGESAYEQPLERVDAQPRGEHPVELVADEDAVAHQIPLLRPHALVVVTDGGQAEFDSVRSAVTFIIGVP